MAEFCLDCYNKLNHTNYKRWQVILADDLCEGCGQYTKTIVVFWADLLPWPFRRYI